MSERVRSVGGSFWGDVDDAEALEGYETLVNEVDDGIYQLDAEGRFVGVNDVIVETTGYTREDLLGEHVSLVLDESDVERIQRDFLERLQTGTLDEVTAHETTVETATGELLSCDLRISLLVSDGEFRGSVGIVRDITERKRRERHLERLRFAIVQTRVVDEFEEPSPSVNTLDVAGCFEHIELTASKLRWLGRVRSGPQKKFDPSTTDIDPSQYNGLIQPDLQDGTSVSIRR